MAHDVCALALSEWSILNFEHQRHKPCHVSPHLESLYSRGGGSTGGTLLVHEQFSGAC